MKKLCYVTTISITIKAFFVEQLKFLSDHGYDVTVVCSPDAALHEILGAGIRYVPMEIPRGISVSGSWRAFRELKEFFRKECFDLIQYSTPNAALYASVAAKQAGCCLRNYHLMGFRYLGATGMGHFILKNIERITCKYSTSIECVSPSNLEIGIAERLFPRDKATVVWNGSSGGVDLKRFDWKQRQTYRSEIRRKYGLGDTFVYGFVGRITKDKGVNEVLEAFAACNSGKLLIVGSPEGVETLEQERYRESLNNPDIIYTGSVDDVERYYAAMDVLLLPSYREGFGNVVIEAAAMGTPAIVSRIPGPIDTVIEGETALIVAAKDAAGLAKAMRSIQQPQYQQLGANAVKYVSSAFGSTELNHYILERKKHLLGE